MTSSLGNDFEKLSKKFNLNLGASIEKGTLDVTVVFQLLMMKYGIRKTFCWIAPNFPDVDDWTKLEMPFGNQMIWLKELKDIVESFGFIVYAEERSKIVMEFNHKMIKNKVGIDDTMIQTLESQIGARDSCNYGDGKRSRKFWILKKELLPDISSITGANIPIGHILEYPDCCINYFVDQKTRILNDCVIDSFNNSFTRDEQVIEFCLENYQRYSYPPFQKLEKEFQNQTAESEKLFRFISHQACQNCMDNPQTSPSAILNETYANFATQIDNKLFSYFDKNGMAINVGG
jgi:hypothetical protein